MEKRQLGRTGMAVSVLGFGGAEIGFQELTVDAVSKILRPALDAGLNVIDTAECYLQGEELIGQAVSDRRKDFYLFTKCGHPQQMGVEDWQPESLLQSIQRSLERLRTNYVDLIQLHSCSEAELRRGDVISALEEARTRGYARFIGYSGDGPATRFAIDCGRFDVLQMSINIADQEAVAMTLPMARQRNIGVIAKRPIANAVWSYPERPDNPYYQPYWDRLKRLDYEFLRGDAKQAAEMALRFTLSIPGVHTAIVGTSRAGRYEENAALLRAGNLAPAQLDGIRGRWREAIVAGSAGRG